MDLDPQPLGTIIRKRARTPSSSSDEEDLQLVPAALKRNHHEDTAQDSVLIPARSAPNFDAIGLLQNLAFTQLYVTATFANFHPHESPVLLFLVRDVGREYEMLCAILPVLYERIPKLQALALIATVPSLAARGPDMLARVRVLPIIAAPEDAIGLFARTGMLEGDGGVGAAAAVVIVDPSSRCRVMRTLEGLGGANDMEIDAGGNEAEELLDFLCEACAALEAEERKEGNHQVNH